MERKPDDVVRLFYGILLPAPAREAVVGLQERLAVPQTRVKWVEPENLHLTLRFLGEMPSLVLRDLKLLGHKLAAEVPPWEMQLQGLGAFPKLKQPQALWVGVGEGSEPLSHLARRLNGLLEDEMIAGGDRKPFHPHCTVGRVKQPQGVRPLIEAMQHEAGFTCESFRCEHFQLMCSTLTETGPQYEVAAEFKLGRS